MFISYNNANNQILQITDDEWFCRAVTKGLDSVKYWTWIVTITTQDSDGHDVITYPSEDFTIVEVTDENVGQRLNQLSTYIQRSNPLGQLKVYNIKWSDSKVSAVTGQDEAGEDITIQTHFSGNDTTKDARLLADEWTRIRAERDRLLTSTDWTQANDTSLASAKVTEWGTYRTSLRDLPSDQSSKTKYSDITWPTKP